MGPDNVGCEVDSKWVSKTDVHDSRKLAGAMEVAFGGDSEWPDAMFIINRVIDMIFVLDIAKEFTLAYKTSTKVGEANAAHCL